MTEITEQINKLQSILDGLDKGTPTYKAVSDRLNDILKNAPKTEEKAENKIFQAIGVVKGILREELKENRSFLSILIDGNRVWF